MQIVEKARMYPQACAVSGRDDGPLIDTMAFVPADGQDRRLYLRIPVLEVAAKKVGMATKNEHDDALARIRELETELAIQEYEIGAARKMLDGVHEMKKHRKPVAA